MKTLRPITQEELGQIVAVYHLCDESSAMLRVALEWVNLRGLDFVAANEQQVSGYTLSPPYGLDVDLSGFDLRGCNFAGLPVRKWNFKGANLRGANFSYTDLHMVDWSNFDLTDVDFSHANLHCAEIRNANITGANFSGTNLTGTDLTGTEETAEQMRHIKMNMPFPSS